MEWRATLTRLPILCGDRATAPRPCPQIECRYHLSTVRDPKGRPSTLERDESYSCALDVADEGEHTLEEISEIVGLTRERVRQIEERALSKLRLQAKLHGLDPSDILARPYHVLDPGPSDLDRQRKRNRDYARMWIARMRAIQANATESE